MFKFIFYLIFSVQSLSFGQNSKGLNFESSHYDFGNLSSKTNAQGMFEFSNTSNKSIEILKIHGQDQCLEINTSNLKSYAPQAK